MRPVRNTRNSMAGVPRTVADTRTRYARESRLNVSSSSIKMYLQLRFWDCSLSPGVA